MANVQFRGLFLCRRTASSRSLALHYPKEGKPTHLWAQVEFASGFAQLQTQQNPQLVKAAKYQHFGKYNFFWHPFSVADVWMVFLIAPPMNHWTFHPHPRCDAAAWLMPLVREALNAASRDEQSVTRATGLHGQLVCMAGVIFPGSMGL